MARSHAAVTNNGWPRQPGEPDPRNGHAAAPGQQPDMQSAGYPIYEEEQGAPGYDPQYAYHYPQHQQHPQQAPRQPHPQHAPAQQGQRGLSSLDRNNTQPAPDYPATQPPYGHAQSPYGQTQSPYGQQPGHPQQPAYGYGQPGAGPAYQQQPHQPAPGFEQWAPNEPAQGPRGYDLGGYHPADQTQPDPLQPDMDWAVAGHAGYGELAPADPYHQGEGHLGYDQAHTGALEQAYSDEAGDYGADEPKRGSWLVRIAGAIVVAVGLGYGLAQGYKIVAGGSSDPSTPVVVRGEAAPTRTLPEDPGGRQFSNTDSKVMGRLGEGATTSAETGSLTESDSGSSATPDGTRRVKPLVVRPDGTIVPTGEPAATAAGPVSVPGVTVIDGFGGGYPAAVTTTTQPPQKSDENAAQAARKPVVVTPPAERPEPEVIARAEPEPAPTPPPSKPAAAPVTRTSPPAASSGGADGYVVVLASVPASSQSRLAALKKFADMQQQYGIVLQNKTPDVKEANLGAKGIYHRLLVGPPGSRSQASELCQQLKASGYKDCWVTAY